MANNQHVDIKFMNQEFRVACAEDEVAILKQAVILVNERIEQMRSTGKTIGVERLIMMVALSLSHDFLKNAAQPFDISFVKGRIANINNLIDTALND